MAEDFFAPPPFKAEEALRTLERQLREMRGLTARAQGWELRGQPVVKLALSPGGDAIEAALARKSGSAPDWDRSVLRQSVDVRKFADAVKARLNAWNDDD